MMTITLTPDLERAVKKKALQQGTTPEIVAMDSLRQQLIVMPEAEAENGSSLADFLGPFVGSLTSGEYVPGGAQMSREPGKQFSAGLAQKQLKGRS